MGIINKRFIIGQLTSIWGFLRIAELIWYLMAWFITTAVFTLLYHLLANNLLRQPLPDPLHNLLLQLGDWLANIVVTAGMRGLLIGIALGTITLSLRILAGWERPYQP